MSYDIKLTRPNNYMTVEEDQIVDVDALTVVLNKPMNSSANVVVRINDFRRPSDFKTETLLREDVSNQITVSNTSTIYVKSGPIYNGLKMNVLATNKDDVVVKIKVVEEDVSSQLTGIENYFVVEGHQLLKLNNYDFNSIITNDDVIIKKNGIELLSDEITDINAASGRIQLVEIPLSTDIITVTYCFRAKVKTLDSINSRIVLKERPVVGQTVVIQYYARVNDGWQIVKSNKSLYENAKDVVFYRKKNTSRIKISNESLNSQVTGSTNTFKVSHFPLLPLYQDFSSDYTDTLNNAVVVTVNGIPTPVYQINPTNGTIALFIYPQVGDLVLASYFYENELTPDRISVDYSTEEKYSSTHFGNVNIADYFIDKLGVYDKVINENKLIQDLRKIIATQRGSDPVAPWYGTNFASFIGTKQLPEFAKTRISSEIVEALTRLKSAQIQQQEYQTVTDNEFLDFIKSVVTTQDEYEPTYYRSAVAVVTQLGKMYEIDEPIFYQEDRIFEKQVTFERF